MIAIIDYGMGNLRSVQKGLERVGFDALVTRDVGQIQSARGVVLPGVGAFSACMENLGKFSLIEPIREIVRQQKPFLGICLGFQLLFSESEEFGKQKGLDLLCDVAPDLLVRYGFQLVVLGSGEGRLEERFSRLQGAYPAQVCFYRGFSNELAHLIEAGADAFVMPSRYEPCGLNQLYSLRYGTVPIVHKTGGLADTVGPDVGVAFEHHDAQGLRWAIETALRLYKDRGAWRRLMLNGMAKDYSWEKQAKVYELLYERAVRAA